MAASPAIIPGSVVLVRFPFSDLSASKLRPAVALAQVDRDDWILVQITSRPYADHRSIELGDADFSDGGLERMSFARPGKLFTGHASLVDRSVGRLTRETTSAIRKAVIDLISGVESAAR